jgi:hypothetical protein
VAIAYDAQEAVVSLAGVGMNGNGKKTSPLTGAAGLSKITNGLRPGGRDSASSTRNASRHWVDQSQLDRVPGDFDEELGHIDPVDVQVAEVSHEGRLVVEIALNEDDAVALQRIADRLHQRLE